MSISPFFLGPHLIGLLFVIIGLLQKYLPPKKINRWYGYRTATARTNQKTWDEGNRYSADYMIKAGIIVFIIGYALNAVSILFIHNAKVHEYISYLILFGGGMGVGIVSTMATEKHLTKTFKNIKPSKRK